MEIKVKHRRGELTITEKDIIMYNGACYQLLTQSYHESWNNINYVLSDTTCKKLIKSGTLIESKREMSSFVKQELIYYTIKV